MSHATLAPYLRPGHPKERTDEISVGNVYVYRATTAIINANKPAIGEAWADGRGVAMAESFEHSAASGLSDLMVLTNANFAASGSLATSLEEVVYELEWRPVSKPIEVHPDFQAGGTYALDATARKHILGWKAEVDPELKADREYKKLDSDGVTAGAATTISGTALNFIKLLEIGVEEFIDYMPVWRKQSMYVGSAAPATSSIGLKGTPSGSGYPSGYEWVKSRDSAQRIGRASKWRRNEEWEGAITVYADKADVFPPA